MSSSSITEARRVYRQLSNEAEAIRHELLQRASATVIAVDLDQLGRQASETARYRSTASQYETHMRNLRNRLSKREDASDYEAANDLMRKFAKLEDLLGRMTGFVSQSIDAYTATESNNLIRMQRLGTVEQAATGTAGRVAAGVVSLAASAAETAAGGSAEADPVNTIIDILGLDLSGMSDAEKKQAIQDISDLLGGKSTGSLILLKKQLLSQLSLLVYDVYYKSSTSLDTVFDESGQYGGDQGSPWANYEADPLIADIVRRHFPDMDQVALDNYLEKLNSEGCGYVAMTNAIFQYYADKPEEFEAAFGFPMYGVDAKGNPKLNFDYLLVDLYCFTDNHNQRSFLGIKWDGIDNEDKSDTEGWGTTPATRAYRLQLYLESKGVSSIHLDTSAIALTAENVRAHLPAEGEGQLIVRVCPVLMYQDGDFENYAKELDGGHAMSIVGVTDDGMIIVSSWGEKYYIKPEDYENVDREIYETVYTTFQVVTYDQD